MTLKQERLPVSVTELFTLLECLKQNVIFGNVDDFYYLSRMCFIKDEKNFPICSGYKCENIINLKYENDPLRNSCVPFGLVVFPNISSSSMANNIDEFLQLDTIENDNIDAIISCSPPVTSHRVASYLSKQLNIPIYTV